MTKPMNHLQLRLEIGPEDEEAGSDYNQEQASTAQTKRWKIQGLVRKCEDEMLWSNSVTEAAALSAKANTGGFQGLRAVTPAKSNTANPIKNSGKDFMYGVLFGSVMTPTTRDMTVRGAYAQCIDLSNKVCFEC